MSFTKYIYLALFAVAFAACSGNKEENTETNTEPADTVAVAPAINGTYTVDAANSNIKWEGKEPVGGHWGNVQLAGGTIEVKENKIAGGNFTVDMSTITIGDLEGEKADKLKGHLHKPDFFSVDSFPTATFTITEVQQAEDKATITGDLTIKGQTHPVTFDVTPEISEQALTAKGTLTFDRTLYGIRYKSKSILGDAADEFILDDVPLEIELKALSK